MTKVCWCLIKVAQAQGNGQCCVLIVTTNTAYKCHSGLEQKCLRTWKVRGPPQTCCHNIHTHMEYLCRWVRGCIGKDLELSTLATLRSIIESLTKPHRQRPMSNTRVKNQIEVLNPKSPTVRSHSLMHQFRDWQTMCRRDCHPHQFSDQARLSRPCPPGSIRESCLASCTW